MIQYRLLIILQIACLLSMSSAQACKDTFMREVTRNFIIKDYQSQQLAREALVGTRYDSIGQDISYRILNIPSLFFSEKGREVRKLRGSTGNEAFYELLRQNFWCYLDPQNMVVEEALLCKDSIAIDYLIEIEPFKFKLSPPVQNQQVVEMLLRIDPIFIFSITNIFAYWYIKDSQLFVISYDTDIVDKEIGFFIFDADTYISQYLTNQDLDWITNQRVYFSNKWLYYIDY